jgi:hypothetical protein
MPSTKEARAALDAKDIDVAGARWRTPLNGLAGNISMAMAKSRGTLLKGRTNLPVTLETYSNLLESLFQAFSTIGKYGCTTLLHIYPAY